MLRQLTYLSLSVLLLCCSQQAIALIVPQELPSLLSLVYSNIPPIKKGTDSRLGFGFRLGEHADFQVIMELGPQKETRPIGDQDPDNSFNKRQVSQKEQLALLRKQQAAADVMTSTERYASSWLQSWSEDMHATKLNGKAKPKQRLATKKKQTLNSVQPTMAALPEDSLKQLQLLYKLATTTHSPIAEPEEQNIAAPIDLNDRLNLQQQSKLMALVNPRNAAPLEKSKAKITKELQNVRLDDDE